MKTKFALVLLVVSFSSMAATSGTLDMTGTVDKILNVSITPATLAAALPLQTSQTSALIGTVLEESNSDTGYTISISSANTAKLKRVGGTETFGYSLTYNGAALDFALPISISNAAGVVSTSKELRVSYTGVPLKNLLSGSYKDTLTFTIAAK